MVCGPELPITRPHSSSMTRPGSKPLRRRQPQATYVSAAISVHRAMGIDSGAAATARVAGIFANPKRCQILFYAAEFPNLTVGDLATLVGSSISLASIYVGQLERDGWVHVRSHRRNKLVFLSDEQARFVSGLRVLCESAACSLTSCETQG